MAGERKVSITTVELIAATRVALGIGLGLLFAGRLNRDQRKAAGLALVLIGGLTTIPLVQAVYNQNRKEE